MLFFYLRHGDPIYNPDSLTPLGERQAEALAKRLALYGIDRIFASTSNRAIQTAKPTCELLKKELTQLDFCHEAKAWKYFSVPTETGRRWAFQHKPTVSLFTEESLLNLGHRWYEHPALADCSFGEGVEQLYRESDALFASFGFEHERYTGRYRITRPNNDRIALFAHQGFGLAFLSCLLDIPYPLFCTRFDICHTGMTVINFEEADGFAVPKILTLSSDSHLYREGLPTGYSGVVRF